MRKKHILILTLAVGSMLRLSAPVYADNTSHTVSTALLEEASPAPEGDIISAVNLQYISSDTLDLSAESYAGSSEEPDTDIPQYDELYSEEQSQDTYYPTGVQVSDYASLFIGNPYRYGGVSLTGGADCSGFLMSVYSVFGIALPHSSAAMRSVGASVPSLNEALPGDILCYSGHVGIYLGDGQMLSALNKKSGITITDANYKRIRAIRRVI